MASSNSFKLDLNAELFSVKLPGIGGALWWRLLNSFWNLDLDQDDPRLRDYFAYHQYFVTELDAWRCYSDNVLLHTYQDLVDLVKHLKENASAPRSSPEVLTFFTSRRASAALATQTSLSQSEAATRLQCENSIFLAVRLWLMVNVGHPNLRKIFPGKTQITWSQDDSVKGLLAAQFPPLQSSHSLIDSQYPRDLNVYELERITGLVVVWTDHLADHLRLDLDLRSITLYHHVSVLKCHEFQENNLGLFPDGLVNETIQTLALLIPRSNIDCKTWYDRHQKLNPNCLDAKISDLTLSPVEGRKQESYKYWNERLNNLYKAFDESQPNGLSQFWKDRRNKVQWYTFWIAIVVLILTLVFGLIQSITGILQVSLANHQ